MSAALDALFGNVHRGIARATVGRPIIYRLFVSSKLTPATGVTVTVYHDVPIRDAVREIVDASEVFAGGAVQVGDVRYRVASAVLAADLRFAASKAPSTSDRVTDGVSSYRVIAWDDDGAVTMVTVRR